MDAVDENFREAGSPRLSVTSRCGTANPPAELRVSPRAGNALRHGLTSRVVLPPMLRSAIGDHLERLRRELRPATHAEELLVREIARHAAFLDFAQEAEAAVLIVGAELPPPLFTSGPEQLGISEIDTALTTSVTSDAADHVSRYRRLHERGFYAALHELQAIQENRLRTPAVPPLAARFTDEARCMAYLVARFNSLQWRCPHCGHPHGYWLAARSRWECSSCRTQIGPRGGTVMQGSPLPLVSWFAAIARITLDLSLSAAGLAEAIGIPRLATARGMIGKVLAALASADADRLLAGLQRTGTAPRTPELSAPSGQVSQNKRTILKGGTGALNSLQPASHPTLCAPR